MRSTKFLAVAAILAARICQAEIVLSTSSPDETTSSVVEDLVQIVTTCFKDRTTAVGLAGNLPDTLVRALSIQHSIPTVLLDDNRWKNATSVQSAPEQYRHKLWLFIIGVSSWERLTKIINSGIRSSIWWNHMASFIILDQSPRCSKIVAYLGIAWRYNLLDANVMCLNRINGQRMIFNYNPFTSEAPAPWAPVYVFTGKNYRPVTLFMLAYLNNDVKCVDLDFVKTKNLGGYDISVDGNPENLKFRDKNFVRTGQEWSRQRRILYDIFRAVNGTPRFTGRTGNFTLNDTEINMRYSVIDKWCSSTYPYQKLGVVVASKFKGHKSQLEKIMSVTDVNTRIGMVVVYFVTLIFFKFFVNQSLASAVLNLVRMTCNSAFANLTDNTAPRIYLSGLLFFVVTIQGIYQSGLASLLTNAIPYKNINSLKDLVNGDYVIYGPPIFDSLIKNFGLEKEFINVIHPTDCIEPVLNDSSTVCLYFADGYIMDVAQNFDLHLSDKYVAEYPLAFEIQRSWYFEEQINAILGRMIEADIYEPWDMKCSPFTLDDFQFDKEVLKNTDYKVLELHEVGFAFIILGIGLLCAIVTFIVEVASHW